MQRWRAFLHQLPILLFAFVLAAAVWTVAIVSNDPSQEKSYPGNVNIEVIGQNPSLVITSELPSNVLVTLRAPASIWSSMIIEKAPVQAVIDLSGMGEGTHTVPVQIQVGIKPAEVVSYNPRSLVVTLEPLETSQFNINVVNSSNPPIGYQAGTPTLDQTTATVSGAKSLVDTVNEVRASIDLAQATSDINETVELKAYDQSGQLVDGVTISPAKVTMNLSVAQLGGFRNVVVKLTTTGQPATGYRLSSITVNPPTVTVYSADPKLIESLPGYVTTDPVNLNGLKDDLNQQLGLRLPDGVTIVGDPTVNVQVSITPVENTLALSSIPVVPIGLASNLTATISPTSADIIIAGPLITLNTLTAANLQVQIDLSGLTPGRHTIQPTTTLNIPDLRIQSIVPTTFEVTIAYKTNK